MFVLYHPKEGINMSENTTDLMQKLITTESDQNLSEYIGSIDGKYPLTFTDFMNGYLEKHGLSIADIQKQSGIDRNYIYQLINGRKNPGRDKIIAIAISAGMSLAECQRALEITNEGILYPKNKRDSVIIYAINNSKSVMDLNWMLEDYNLPKLNT